MARKVFISVLGAGFYGKCVYGKADRGFRSSETRFVQQATLEYLGARGWSEDDAVYILTTEKAKKDNWDKTIATRMNFHTKQEEDYKGLERILLDMGLHCTVETVDIPNGVNEEEIWQIFEKLILDVNGKSIIREGDELYFDLTHGFRYLPMLVLVLGNYAKFMKKTRKCSITYGNFEMKDADGVAPIIDLLPLAALQDWTYAIGDYMNNGYVDEMELLANESLVPILSNRSAVKDEALKDDAKNMKGLVSSIKKVAYERQTCRGISVIDSKSVNQLRDNIEKTSKVVVKAFRPLVDKIGESLNTFDVVQNVMNMFAAAQWCYDNHQYQSATTFLEEGVITYFCQRHGVNYLNEDLRNMVTYAFTIKKFSIGEDKWNVTFEKGLLLRRLLNDPLMSDMQLVNSFQDFFSSVRNDYNHCGIRSKNQPLQPAKLIKKIGEYIELISKILADASPLVTDKKPLLVNLSNHPLATWSWEQREAAKEYGEIIDMAFPQIEPDASENDMCNIVDEYMKAIKSQMDYYEMTFHLMGEMTFTYKMVVKLKELGLRCVASTTERNTVITSDGKKISDFCFVKFREY